LLLFQTLLTQIEAVGFFNTTVDSAVILQVTVHQHQTPREMPREITTNPSAKE